MVIASKVTKDFLASQQSIEKFCEEIEISRQTVYNIMDDKNVSSEIVAKLLTATGFDFEKAFEVKE